MSVAIELMCVQESVEQRAHTPPHATNLQQLTFRLYSMASIDTRNPLLYACTLQSNVSVHMHMRSRNNLFGAPWFHRQLTVLLTFL
jgi:hypothetical protein